MKQRTFTTTHDHSYDHDHTPAYRPLRIPLARTLRPIATSVPPPRPAPLLWLALAAFAVAVGAALVAIVYNL